MEGAGNDYIYINCFEEKVENPSELSIKLSDRHFGIGGDGIILILPSEIADAKMRIFNADGSEGKMCGNGIRCVAKFLYDNRIVKSSDLTVDTLSGIKKIKLTVENGKAVAALVDMGKPELNPKKIPIASGKDKFIAEPITVLCKEYKITGVSMGNPHAVTFIDDVTNLEIEKIGPLFEHNPLFPERVNTEFAKVLGKNKLQMRVWERGSGETLACGTGACATAVAAVLNGYCKMNEEIEVVLLGGSLFITYTDNGVFMKGPAKTAFKGTVEI